MMPRSMSTAITTTTRYPPDTDPWLLIAQAYASVVSGMKKNPTSGHSLVSYAQTDVVTKQDHKNDRESWSR